MRKPFAFLFFFYFLYCTKGYELKDLGKVENFLLIDQNGEKREFTTFAGKTVLLYFGYTHCPDFCPVTLSKLSRLYEELPEEKKPQIVFITVDPERDTPERLKNYLMNFPAPITGLTGSRKEIDEVARQFGVYYRIERKFDHIHIEHTTLTYFIDRNLHIRYTFPFQEKIEVFKEVINTYHSSEK